MAKKQSASLGALIDDLYFRRAKRIEAQRKVDAMKVEERAAHILIIDLLKASKTTGARGLVATAAIVKDSKPKVSDWLKFWAYCKKEDAGHLLHKRVAVEAWAEIIAAGKKVPGVEAVEVEDLSLTKSLKT